MSGQKVLCVWECGQHLGHISSLVAVSNWAVRAGIEPVWAVSASKLDAVRAHVPWRCLGVEEPLRYKRERILSYADILASYGFLDGDGLTQRMHGWQKLYEREKPDCIVMDCAPTAQLAAYLFGWPAVQISNGFDTPPADCPTFGYGLRGQLINNLNANTISALNQTLSGLGQELVGRPDVSLTGYLNAPTRWIARVTEADPYGARHDVNYIGPPAWEGKTRAADWPEASDDVPKVFAYLRANTLLRPTLEWLARSGMSVLCCCPDLPDEQQMLGALTKIVRHPVSVDQVWQQADAVVSYGATTFVCQALLAGKPQWILPPDVEKWMVAQRLQQLGACVLTTQASAFPDAFAAVFSEKIKENAQSISQRYQNTNWQDSLEQSLSTALRN